MQRPKLNKIELNLADLFQQGTATITMSIGQWDEMLKECYDEGFFLLELNDDESPVALYQKK